MNKKIMLGIIIIIVFGIGYTAGYATGFMKAIEFGLRKVGNVIDIEFEEKEIARAIFLYRNRVDVCFPDKLPYFPQINITEAERNASLHDDTWD